MNNDTNNIIAEEASVVNEVEPVAELAVSRSSRKLDPNRLILPVAILIAAIMVSGTLLYTKHATSNAPTVSVKPTTHSDVAIGDSPVLGDPNAKVAVIEFGDFQCPYCKMYFQNNQSAIVADYVKAGKVKFVWKDYAFLGQESTWSAEASRCANDQGKFWEYHDYLYSHQGSENAGAFTKVKLVGFATALGLNTAQFKSCLDSDKYADAVAKETKYGGEVGVQGTPATFVNGDLISGAVPYSQIKAAIDSALQKTTKKHLFF